MTTATNWFVVLQTSEVLREGQRQEVGTVVSISPGLSNECSQKHRLQLRNRRHEAEYSKYDLRARRLCQPTKLLHHLCFMTLAEQASLSPVNQYKDYFYAQLKDIVISLGPRKGML